MSGGIAAEVFDFVDELADGLRDQSFSPANLESQDSIALTFCDALFEQFFGAIGLKIIGFSMASKRRASTHAEQLGAAGGKQHVRRMIVRYEELCDSRLDLVSDYGSESISDAQTRFHTEYLVDLLATSHEWAVAEGLDALAQRIGRALSNYDDAVGRSAW